MGSFRSQPDLTKHSQEKKGNALSYATSHMCGWRIYMQDAHISVSPLSDKKNSIFGVFDGHGGAQVSTFVERHFVEELEKNSSYQKKEYDRALKDTFVKMDELMLTEAGKKEIISIQKEMRDKDNGPKYEEESHAGCTANVVLITPEWTYCANAGDSRAVAKINGKDTFELSRDHKPENPVELDRITKAGGTVSFGRVNGCLNLSRAMGDFEYKKQKMRPEQQMITSWPDVIKVKTDSIDFIIMGCDGIWQVKENNQMVEWVSKRISKQKSSQSILQELLDQLVSKDSGNQYGMDNMSAILVKFDKRK